VAFVVGCASPENATNDPIGNSSPDLSSDGTGGNGVGDMAGGGGGTGGVGGGGGNAGAGGGGGGGGVATQDMAMAPDLAMPADMAKPADMVVVPMCTLNVPASTCGIWPQCGCTGTQNCNVENTTTFAASCAPSGTTGDYNNCTGNGDSQCAKGRSCVNGVCMPFCGTTTDCPGSYRACVGVDNSAGTAITGMNVCTQFCDPTNPTSSTGGFSPCGPSVGCVPNSSANGKVSTCLGPAGTGVQGDDCTTSSEPDDTKCSPGYGCVSIFSVVNECEKFCYVGVSGQCTGGTSCGSFSTKQYAGAQEIGSCS
jgi:hypothetical protein